MSKKGLPYGKQTGYKIPKDYFGDFESRLIEKISSRQSYLPVNSNPFKVPNSYFNKFEERFNEKLNFEIKEPKVIALYRRKYISYAGVAAVLAVILSSVILNQSKSFDYNDLDMMAVENYLLETIEFSSPEETHLLKEGDFSFASSRDATLDREAVLEYLNENMEEPSLLLND